jgi:uncharacterized iron-regulated membrane protein
MNLAIVSRKVHKWLSLFVGLQIVLWTISGFYMVVVDLDFIHGDSLVRNLQVPLPAQSKRVPFVDVARTYPDVTQVSLRALPEFSSPVYEVTTQGRKVLLDAATGRQLSPLTEDTIRSLAKAYYAGQGQLAAVTLLEGKPPLEIQSRRLPLWRADFADWLETSLYVHPDTGVLVTRRHRLWRWFDFLWMFHIMDYDQRTDMNNGLLRVSTVLAGITVASGVWLLYFSFRRRRPSIANSQRANAT